MLPPGWSTVANTPFRKHKTWTHEGGVATPLIVHWPKGIKAKNELRHDPGHVIDVVPTILDLTGQTVTNDVAFPGKSLKSSFTADQNWQRTIWFSHESNNAIRVGDWKLVKSKNSDWELFNLKKDRAETANLAGSNPEKVQELIKIWESHVDDFRKTAPKGKGKPKKKKPKK